MPTGKQIAWMAAVALATLLAFESYKAKRGAPGHAGGGVASLWGRVGA